MKRILFIVAIIVIASSLFVACKEEIRPESSQYGSLNLNADSARTIEPNLIEITCASYKAIGTHSDGVHFFQQSFTGKSVTIGQLLVGSWSVYIEGYNSDGVLIAKSSTLSLTIQPAVTTSASFQLGYLTEGNGTLSITVKVPASDSAVYAVDVSVINSSGIEDVLEISKSANAVDGYYVFSGSKTIYCRKLSDSGQNG